jgi:hypothetical protein
MLRYSIFITGYVLGAPEVVGYQKRRANVIQKWQALL